MKTNFKMILFVIMISMIALVKPQKVSAQVDYVNFQVFYDELSPYGTWVINPEFGYVWVPDVGLGFTPYATNGYWAFTEVGWTWISYYPWGWAPFHYGRWFFDPIYGHIWVPGNEWGPGWVTWRRSADYYGWTPMEPGVDYYDAYADNYHPHYNHWTILRGDDFGRSNYDNYYVNSTNNTEIINNSVVINNVYVDNSSHVTYNTGPNKKDVEKQIGKPISTATIKESNKPGQQVNNNEVSIYKPHIQKDNSASTSVKPAPSKVTNLKDVTPLKQRPAESTKQNTNQPVKQQNGQQIKQNSPQENHQAPVNKAGNVSRPVQNVPANNVNQPNKQPQAVPKKNTVYNQPQKQGKDQQNQQSKPSKEKDEDQKKQHSDQPHN